MRFSYTRVEDSFLPGGVAYLPLVDVNVGKYKVPLKCLIDSGSPVTIMHSPIGVATGIIPVEGQKSSLRGIGSGEIAGYYHTLKLSLYGNTFKIQFSLPLIWKFRMVCWGRSVFLITFELISDCLIGTSISRR